MNSTNEGISIRQCDVHSWNPEILKSWNPEILKSWNVSHVTLLSDNHFIQSSASNKGTMKHNLNKLRNFNQANRCAQLKYIQFFQFLVKSKHYLIQWKAFRKSQIFDDFNWRRNFNPMKQRSVQKPLNGSNIIVDIQKNFWKQCAAVEGMDFKDNDIWRSLNSSQWRPVRKYNQFHEAIDGEKDILRSDLQLQKANKSMFQPITRFQSDDVICNHKTLQCSSGDCPWHKWLHSMTSTFRRQKKKSSQQRKEFQFDQSMCIFQIHKFIWDGHQSGRSLQSMACISSHF
jgi:hypothetical protein